MRFTAVLFLLIQILGSQARQENCVQNEEVCIGLPKGKLVPFAGCRDYAECGGDGETICIRSCPVGTMFDVWLYRCDSEEISFCLAKTCSPTMSPSETPTFNPTKSPTKKPTSWPSRTPTETPTDSPTKAIPYDFFAELDTDEMKQSVEEKLLQAYLPSGISYPSTKYSFKGLVNALSEMDKGIISDGRRFRFYTSYNEGRLDYG